MLGLRQARALCWAALLGAALSAAPATAQEGPAGVRLPAVRAVTLREAIAYAESHSPAVLPAEARVRAAEAAAEVPGAAWWPSVGATAQLIGSTVNNSTATILSNPRVDLPRIGATPTSADPSMKPYASTLAAVGLRQQLFDFGRIAAQTAALDARADLERRRAAGARLDVALQVTEAYYAVLAAKAVATAARQAAERSAAHRDAARAAAAAGLRPEGDIARAEADIARFEVAALRAEGGLGAARAVLAAVVGAQEPELDAAAPAGEEPPLPPLEELVQRARGRGAAVRERTAAVEAARAETRAAAAEARPNVFLTAAISGRAGGAPPSNGDTVGGYGLAPLVPNWDVGVVLSVPIYDPVISARRDALRAAEGVRVAELEATRAMQEAAVRQAYVTALYARAARAALDRAAEAARANHAQAEARFKAGLGTVLELADAEALRVEAEVQQGIGDFQVARARAQLERAVSEGR